MASHTFEIRGSWYNDKTFPSLNDYIAQIGRNPKGANKFKSKYKTIAISSIRKHLRGLNITKPVIIHYEFAEPSKGQKRDYMNIFSCADKFIEDALQDAKILKGDDPRYVKNTTHEFYYTDGEPYIRVTLEEVDNV